MSLAFKNFMFIMLFIPIFLLISYMVQRKLVLFSTAAVWLLQIRSLFFIFHNSNIVMFFLKISLIVSIQFTHSALCSHKRGVELLWWGCVKHWRSHKQRCDHCDLNLFVTISNRSCDSFTSHFMIDFNELNVRIWIFQ